MSIEQKIKQTFGEMQMQLIMLADKLEEAQAEIKRLNGEKLKMDDEAPPAS